MVEIKKGSKRMEVSEGSYENFYKSAGWVKTSKEPLADEWEQVLSEEDERKERRHERSKRG